MLEFFFFLVIPIQKKYKPTLLNETSMDVIAFQSMIRISQYFSLTWSMSLLWLIKFLEVLVTQQ